MTRVFCLTVSVCCLLTACLPPRTQLVSPDDEVLDDFIDEYYRERFAFYPSQSTAAGFGGHDDELERFDEESIRRRIAWLADFRLRLIAIRVEALSRFAHPEALSLRSQVEEELWHLEQWGAFRHQVDFYLEPARSGLRALLVREAEDIVSPLLGRLEGFALLCQAARANLTSASPAERQSGLEAVRRSQTFLIAALDRVLPEVRDHERVQLKSSRDTVLRELRGLATLIQSLPPDAEPRSLGERAFSQYWVYSAMVDLTPTQMELMAESELSRIRGEIDDLMLTAFPGETPSAVLMALQGHPAPSAPEDEVATLIESLSQRSSPLGRIRIDAMTRVEQAADAIVAPRVVHALAPPPLEPIAEGLALVSIERTGNTADWLKATTEAVRQLAGHAVQNEYRSRSMSLLRKVGSTRTSREGWALLMESRVLRASWPEAETLDWPAGISAAEQHDLRQYLRLFVLRRSLVEHLRLVASIRFHRDGLNDVALRQIFSGSSYLDPREIDREWQRVQLDPGVGSAALGCMLLVELERDFRHKFPAAAVDTFYEKFLQAGVLPIRLVRLRLLGETGGLDESFGFRSLTPIPGTE